jgi:hypothetical protein
MQLISILHTGCSPQQQLSKEQDQGTELRLIILIWLGIGELRKQVEARSPSRKLEARLDELGTAACLPNKIADAFEISVPKKPI